MTYDLTTAEIIQAAPTAVLDGFVEMYGENGPPWIHHSELDLRVGGTWTVDFGPPGPPPFHEDRTITAYQPGRQLAYTVTATYQDTPPLHTAVDIRCEALDDQTRVTLTQSGFPTTQQRDEFVNAWRDVLAELKNAVETTVSPDPDPP
jgi:uncharacterized protein YndB with AHSA1/START domain